MSEERKTNRQFWIAIGFIAALAVVSFVIKTVVYEMTKPEDGWQEIVNDRAKNA